MCINTVEKPLFDVNMCVCNVYVFSSVCWYKCAQLHTFIFMYKMDKNNTKIMKNLKMNHSLHVRQCGWGLFCVRFWLVCLFAFVVAFCFIFYAVAFLAFSSTIYAPLKMRKHSWHARNTHMCVRERETERNEYQNTIAKRKFTRFVCYFYALRTTFYRFLFDFFSNETIIMRILLIEKIRFHDAPLCIGSSKKIII